MTSTEEPSYLAFARANIRDAHASSPAVVRGLVERIDRDAKKPKAMTQDQRDKLLALHRAATAALDKVYQGGGHPSDHKAYFAADDAFRDYLYSLDVTA